MSHSCNNPTPCDPDLNSIPGAPSIGAVVVIYNKKCTESASFSQIVTYGEVLVILVDNSTDPDLQHSNRESCLRLGCEYYSMGGNKGLAQAYNAAISQIGSRTNYLMLLDDDTAIPQDVLSVLEQSIALHPSASVFVPLVLDQAALLSPSRRWSSLFFRLKKKPDAFTQRMSAINSGLVIRLDRETMAKPLFDDKMFLDCIDHDFILRRVRKGESIVIYPAEFHQNFFDGTSRGLKSRDHEGETLPVEEHSLEERSLEVHSQEERDPAGQKKAALVRFAIFAKDYLYFCRDCSLNMAIAHMYLIYRMTRLNMRFRTMEFGRVLKSSKITQRKA